MYRSQAGTPDIARETDAEIGAERKFIHPHFRFHLAIAEEVAPAGRIDRVEPQCGAESGEGRAEVLVGPVRFRRNSGVGTAAGNVKPVESGQVIVKKVVSPAELQSQGEIIRLCLMGQSEITERDRKSVV